MKRKSILLLFTFILILVILTGCGISENIKILQETKFHNWRGETEYTYREAMEEVMSNVKWNEYYEDNINYIKITGKEKDNGNQIEIIFSKQDNNTFKREEIIVNGEAEDSVYYNDMFTDI